MNKYWIKFYLLMMALLSGWGLTYSQDVIHVDLTGLQMAYSHGMKKLFIYGRADEDDDSKLYIVDALTGRKSVLYDFGHVINAMAVSPDQSLLYIAQQHLDSSILVIKLPELTIESAFSIRPNQSSPMYISRQIIVSPSDPHIIALSRQTDLFPNGEMELVIYDHGVARPEVQYTVRSFFTWSDKHSLIYGKDNGSAQGDLHLFKYDQSGVMAPDTIYYYMRANSGLTLYNDKLYGWDQSVIDVSDEVPVFFGRLTAANFNGNMADAENDRIIHFYNGLNKIDIHTFHPERLTPVGPVITIPAMGDLFKQFTQLGNGRDFAVIGEEDILIVRFCESRPPKPVLGPEYEKAHVLCIPSTGGAKLVVPNPSGYDFVIDQDGHYHDSLIIVTGGSYTVRVADQDGCLSEPSEPVFVQTWGVPAKSTLRIHNGNSFSYQADVNRCDNGKTFFDAHNIDQSVKHIWSNGFVGEQLETDALGEFWVIGVNDHGCQSDTSDIITVHALNSPTPEPPKILSPDSFNGCNVSPMITLFAESGYEKYDWNFGIGGTQNDTSITIHYGNYQSVRLRGRNSEGCWSDFSTADIHFYPHSPGFPGINVLENFLSPNMSGEAYEWYLNDVLIPNSNIHTWRALVPGDYKVRVHDGVCWSELSFKKTIQ